MDNIERALKKFKKHKLLGEGTNRRVHLYSKELVIKIPLNEEGIEENYSEAKKYREHRELDDVRYAKSWIENFYGIPVLFMERAYPITRRYFPKWALDIESGQIGKTKKGLIVAFDYAD